MTNIAKRLLFIFLSSSCTLLQAAEKSANPLSAVVKIEAVSCSPDFFSPWRTGEQSAASGSGVVIEGNYILTNSHNIADATYIAVEREQNGIPVPAKVKAVNHQCDLALLEVEDKSFFDGIKPFEIGNTPPAQTPVFVVGYPMGGDGISVTQGIISRIESMQYAQYPYMNHIAAQLDAAINPGNSGGPILFENKIAGIAFQSFKEGEGLGYMIHTDIINHFLNEVKSGEIKGFGSLCITYQTLQSADTRRFLKMKKHHSGVMIVETFANADLNLKEGDVILSIDGFKILNNGNVITESGENVSFGVITDRKCLGDTVKLRLLRDGKELEADVELKAAMHKIAPHYYNKSPEYLLVGGFVFTKLSLSLLDEYRRVPDEMSVLFSKTNSDADEETIILAQTLGDVSTEGYKGVGNLILKSVNGKKVKNLKELAKMYDLQNEGFFIMESNNGIKIIVDIKNLKDSLPRIMKNYKISSDRNL